MIPHPSTTNFMKCINSEWGWKCPNHGGQCGNWYILEVVPREYATMALGNDEYSRMEFSSEEDFMWMLEKEVQRKCAVIYAVAVNTNIVELMEEEEEEK